MREIDLRVVTRNQAAMPDHSPLSSPSQNQTKHVSSFFGSPRLFKGYLSRSLSETETMSPVSILDAKPFSIYGSQSFRYDKSFSAKVPKIFPGNKNSWEELDSRGIGLVLEDSLADEKTEINSPKSNARMILSGSKLNVQIPLLSSSPSQSPKSPSDFGIKTRDSQMVSPLSVNSPRALSGYRSLREMELSEDYTCVISHGPNPRTIHIFDNCIVGSCPNVVGLSEPTKERCRLYERSESPSEGFLNFCYTCKKSLRQGKDIYISGGERAFCSRECRCAF